jgi:hypothetical protein
MISIEIAESFNHSLDDVEEFLLLQDRESALRRFERFQTELFAFIERIRAYPRIGRPFSLALDDASDESLRDLNRVVAAFVAAGLTEAREYVLRDYVLLDAHSDVRAVLISVKHQRELRYDGVVKLAAGSQLFGTRVVILIR